MKNKNKFLRKIVLGVLSLAMIFSMTSFVFAADEKTADLLDAEIEAKKKECELISGQSEKQKCENELQALEFEKQNLSTVAEIIKKKEKECDELKATFEKDKEEEDKTKYQNCLQELQNLRYETVGQAGSNDIFEVALETPFSRPPAISDTKIETAEALQAFFVKSLSNSEDYDCELSKEKTSVLCISKTDSTSIWRLQLRQGDVAAWQQVIRGSDGNEILGKYIGLIYKFIGGFIGLIAVLMIVISGIQISFGGASEEAVSSGKERIIAALAGLALVFLSGVILYTINPTFFSTEEIEPEVGIELEDMTYKLESVDFDYEKAASSDVVEEGELSHAKALEMLGDDFALSSTNNCSDRNGDGCTSLQKIRAKTITGIKKLKEICDDPKQWVITGGSEIKPHEEEGKSHPNGYKIDLGIGSNQGNSMEACMKDLSDGIKGTSQAGGKIAGTKSACSKESPAPSSPQDCYSLETDDGYTFEIYKEDSKHYDIRIF